jgi:hypothetical protein
METKYQRMVRRDKEREALVSELNQGTREINRNLNEMGNWADRIMRSILKPMGGNIKTLWNPDAFSKKGSAPYKADR